MHQLVGVLGLCVFLFVCYLLSSDRKRVPWGLAIKGIALQFIFALVILRTQAGRSFFDLMNDAVNKFLEFSQQGSSFVFGGLSKMNIPVGTAPAGSDPAFATLEGTSNLWAHTGSYFAFGVLPTVIFFSLIMAVLYHLGIMQKVVWVFAWIMKKTLGTRGAETVSAAGNIFLGQTEAPLLVKPYLATMSNSELLAIMIGDMANTAGGVMAAYVGFLVFSFPDIAGHLMSESVMSAPASLLVAKWLLPAPAQDENPDELKVVAEKIDANVLDAASRGVTEGVQLVLNIAGMLIGFIAAVALMNFMWASACGGVSWATGWDLARFDSFQELLGYAFAPVAWLMGIPWKDCMEAGALLGEKIILNEFIAYAHLGDYLHGVPILDSVPVHELDERTKVILSYALCGFANISSIGILLGGMGSMAPNRRGDIARLGIKALIGGTIATFMTATIAGILC